MFNTCYTFRTQGILLRNLTGEQQTKTTLVLFLLFLSLIVLRTAEKNVFSVIMYYRPVRPYYYSEKITEERELMSFLFVFLQLNSEEEYPVFET